VTAAAEDAELVCSAKGCTAPAAHELRWNNPKIHDAERRKVWLACDEHRETLTAFLGARGFLREVVPLGADGAGESSQDSAADR
jgi:hypothetical protein